MPKHLEWQFQFCNYYIAAQKNFETHEKNSKIQETVSGLSAKLSLFSALRYLSTSRTNAIGFLSHCTARLFGIHCAL